MPTKYVSSVLLVAAFLALSACGSKPVVISVGAKNTTEQSILGEIIATHLEKQLPNVKIERRFALGGALVVQGAMEAAAVDVYVEDVGTMEGTILHEEVPLEENVGLERARAQYLRRFQVTVMKPLGFHHKFVVVSYPQSNSGIKSETLSELAATGKALKWGVAYDLFDRQDAFTPLTTKYNVFMRELPLRMEPQAMYPALKAGTIDLAAGYSTDSWTNQEGYRILKDDRQLFPAHEACLMVRNPAIAKVHDLQRSLEALVGMIKDDTMLKMNQDVDLRHHPAVLVAKEFLASAGL